MSVYIVKTDESFEKDLKRWLDSQGESYYGYTRENAIQTAILEAVGKWGGGLSVIKISEDGE